MGSAAAAAAERQVLMNLPTASAHSGQTLISAPAYLEKPRAAAARAVRPLRHAAHGLASSLCPRACIPDPQARASDRGGPERRRACPKRSPGPTLGPQRAPEGPRARGDSPHGRPEPSQSWRWHV